MSSGIIQPRRIGTNTVGHYDVFTAGRSYDAMYHRVNLNDKIFPNAHIFKPRGTSHRTNCWQKATIDHDDN